MPLRTPARVLSIAAFVALAACSDGGSSPATTSTTMPATSTTARPDDGRLLLGVVLPRSGPGAELGASMSDAVTLAVKEINSAGGVQGVPVEVVAREEGANPASAAIAVQDLVQLGVDAIIGPASSLDTLGTLDKAVAAGVLTCSPTASALALDQFPANGLFFRTVPSDSLQATAMAHLVEESGSSTAAVVYLDDGYGRPFAHAVEVALAQDGTKVTATSAFTATDTSLAATVAAVQQTQPEVVVVVADGTTGPAVVAAIDGAIGSRRPTYVVNDAMRRPAPSVKPFGRELAGRVLGVSPFAYATSPAFMKALHGVDADATGLFAYNAYDCVDLIALAAQAAGSTRPHDIATNIAAVSTSGAGCGSYLECETALAEGRNVNYEGPSGLLAIGSDGNVTSAVFERFAFDESGRDVGTGTMRVGSG